MFRCLVVEMLNCLSSQRTTDKQLNRPEASTPNNDHVPGQTSLPRQRPPLHGYREMTLAAGPESVFSPILGGFWASKRVFGAILGGFWASNRFLAQSSAGLGLQIGFWPNPRRVLGSESVFGAILGGFWASNWFLAQSSAGLGAAGEGRRQRVA